MPNKKEMTMCLTAMAAAIALHAVSAEVSPRAVLDLPPGPGNSRNSEGSLVELKDGRTLLYFRTNVGRQYYAYSSDGGATWGAAEPSPLYSPLSPATVHRLKTGELVCFWNDHENRTDLAKGGPNWASGVRTPLTVGISTDEGRTWPRRKLLEDKYDPKDWQRYWYCYTAVLELKDRLLVAYCAERNLKHLRITSVPLAWLPSAGEMPRRDFERLAEAAVTHPPELRTATERGSCVVVRDSWFVRRGS